MEKSAQVFDLKAYKAKKQETAVLARGRKPLYATHLPKKTGTTYLANPETPVDFALRIARIRKSIENINALVTDLKKLENNSAKRDR